MSRVINPEGVGKERTQLSRSVVIAIQELMRQSAVDEKTHDLAAFIVLALAEISKTIDVSVAAWEKRGYWLKADRFRMEWAWSESMGLRMKEAILKDDWEIAAATAAQVAEKLKNVQLLKRPPKDEFWKGAWKRLLALNSPKR